MFDLLGFDRFEFIQELLQHRKQLISATYDSVADMASKPFIGMQRLFLSFLKRLIVGIACEIL